MPKKKWHHLLKEYKEDTCEFNYLNKKLKNHIKNIIKQYFNNCKYLCCVINFKINEN